MPLRFVAVKSCNCTSGRKDVLCHLISIASKLCSRRFVADYQWPQTSFRFVCLPRHDKKGGTMIPPRWVQGSFPAHGFRLTRPVPRRPARRYRSCIASMNFKSENLDDQTRSLSKSRQRYADGSKRVPDHRGHTINSGAFYARNASEHHI